MLRFFVPLGQVCTAAVLVCLSAKGLEAQDGGAGKDPKVPLENAGLSVGANWLLEMQRQFETAYEARVVQPYKKGLAELETQFQETLKKHLDTSKRSGRRQDTVVFQQELDRFEASSNRVPAEDSDSSSDVVRLTRNQLRAGVKELEQQWEVAAGKVRLEFDATLVKAAQRLIESKLSAEAPAILAGRNATLKVWLAQASRKYGSIREKHNGSGTIPMPEQNVRGFQVDDASQRKKAEAAVRWVLGVGGTLTYRDRGQVVSLTNNTKAFNARGEWISLVLDGEKVGRPLRPGELDALSVLKGLESVQCKGLEGDLGGLRFLRGRKSLKSVDLEKMVLDERCVEALDGCGALTSLSCINAKGVSAQMLKHWVSAAPEIGWLSLAQTEILGGAAEAVSICRNLRTLDLSGTKFSEADSLFLAQLKNLRALYLGNIPLKGEAINALKTIPIQALGLGSGDGDAFDQILQTAVASFPKLQEFRFYGDTISLNQATAISMAFRDLKVLDLWYAKPLPGAMERFSQLHRLEAFCCRALEFDDADLSPVLQRRGIRRIEVGSTAVSDRSLEGILNAAKQNLRSLSVRGSKVSSDALRQIKKAAPSLMVIE
jgi:hypothetical protein